MAKAWTSFLPYVQPYLPGCPEIVITSHLQEAAADFLARSEIWRYNIEEDFTSKSTSDDFLALGGINQHFFHLSGSLGQPNSGGVHCCARHVRKRAVLCRLVRLVVADITR